MSPSNIVRTLFLSFLIAALICPDATYGRSGASDETNEISSDKGCHCFRGRPASECRMYWITEVGYLTTLGSKNTPSSWNDNERLTFDIGYMFNVSEKNAVGASLFWHTFTGGDYSYWGFKPRYRRWLSNDVGLDVCLGVGLWEYEFNRNAMPLVAQLGISFKDYFSVTLLYDRAKWTESVPILYSNELYDGNTYTSSTFSVGLKAGSYAGLVAVGVTAVVAALVTVGPIIED